MEQKLSYIELKAQEADQFPRYRSIKISYVREKISEMLNFIGTSGFFEEYTRHDITHIDAMFDLACDIIPESTKAIMTPIEWLLLTFAIYFHDMGMIVTREEYKDRNKSNFANYKLRVENGEYGKDFAAKVKTLEDPEKFLYQEFVREHHADRVSDWIRGNKNYNWGASEAAYTEVQRILNGLDDVFKDSLSIVCLSHHKNDLYDTEKYKLDEVFDNAKKAKANLQYVSIVLRTADLLHITSNRTPTIAYHLISPNDPKSIIEWEKQSAVIAVSPISSNDDCDADESSKINDTFSIRARFSAEKSPEAYFGLNSYLKYAEKQLISDGRTITTSESKVAGKGYIFPWKYIDDKRIETPGFEKKQFQFDLDQQAILELLVGHTLYNDSSVVLRELIQNGIDAVKCQVLNDKKEGVNITKGLVQACWDSNSRVLTFIDNGTGMTLFDVENYLLKVGASKYRTPEFKQQNPDFSAISRFGIGILTCFLVADDIDIFTNSLTDDALHIAIRNVNGKYLVKHLKKETLDAEIRDHGTIIQLRLHESVDMYNIDKNIRKWIVLPEVEVRLRINDHPYIKIGYDSPKEALQEYCGKLDGELEIFEETEEGVTLAFITTRNRYFEDYQITSTEKAVLSNDFDNPIGICIEGIRVETNTPGYTTKCFYACCNVTGRLDTHTNVARSEIELNEEKKHLLRIIYRLYTRNIERQFNQKLLKYKSLSRASQEVSALIYPLNAMNSYFYNAMLEDPRLFNEVVNKLPILVLEVESTRRAVSAQEILDLNHVVILQNRVISSTESLISATQTEKSVVQMMEFLGLNLLENVSDKEHLLCNFTSNSFLYNNAIANKEAVEICVDSANRITILRLESSYKRWVTIKLARAMRVNSYDKIYLPIGDVHFTGLNGEIGVVTMLGLYMKPSNPFSNFFLEIQNKFNLDDEEEMNYCAILLQTAIDVLETSRNLDDTNLEERFDSLRSSNIERYARGKLSPRSTVLDIKIDKREFFELVKKEKWDIFDQSRWLRSY